VSAARLLAPHPFFFLRPKFTPRCNAHYAPCLGPLLCLSRIVGHIHCYANLLQVLSLCIIVHCVAVSIRFLLIVVKEGAIKFSFNIIQLMLDPH